MATLRSISITFDNAVRQSQQLNSNADELKKTAAQLNEVISTLRSGWKGEAADLYINKCIQLQNKLNRTASDLERISSTIYKSAKAYYDAERKAIILAQTKARG